MGTAHADACAVGRYVPSGAVCAARQAGDDLPSIRLHD